MRIIVNYLAAADSAKTGVGHYTAEMLRCVRQKAGEDIIDTFPGSWGGGIHNVWTRYRRTRIPTPGNALAGQSRISLRQRLFHGVRACGRTARRILFRQLCRWKKYDLYHEPNFLPMPCDCQTVATLHDLSVLLHPEWHPAERVAQFEKHFRLGLSQCSHFFTVSEFVRWEVIQTLGLPPSRVTRTYNGVRPCFVPMPAAEVAGLLQNLGLPPRYLLYVGTIEPRKNIMTLLRAYCALPERIRSDWPLLLVGGWGWNAADVADFLESGARQRGVLYRPYVPEGSLAALYNGARALVYPSLYEGFGLPPVEMLACGGAVLASTAGALVETVGQKAHLIEPLDLDGWRWAMLRIIEDDDWWQALRRDAAESVRQFTWEQCAEDTLRVYRRLGGKEANIQRPLAA